jgi:hypothetical protein
MQGGVDTSLIKWVPYDGIGRTVRNGINFTERGFGLRGALGVSDRANTAASQLKRGDIDWEYIFGALAMTTPGDTSMARLKEVEGVMKGSALLRADKDRSAAILERIPAGRWGLPDDLMGPVIFLASSASDYVYGYTVAVDGGWLAR